MKWLLPLTLMILSCSTRPTKLYLDINRTPNAVAAPALPISLARECFREICADGPKFTPEKLRRSMSSQVEYRKSDFFKKMDEEFKFFTERQAEVKKVAEQMLGEFRVHADAPENFKQKRDLILYLIWKNIGKVLDSRKARLEKAGTAYSFYTYLKFDAEDIQVADLPDEYKNVLYQIILHPKFSELIRAAYGVSKVDFETVRANARKNVTDLELVEQLQTICRQNLALVSAESSVAKNILYHLASECEAQPEELSGSRRRLDTLVTTYYRLQRDLIPYDGSFDDVYRKFKFAEADFENLTVDRSDKSCHDVVAQEWNLARWPQENTEKIQQISKQQVELVGRLFADLPDYRHEDFMRYLHGLTFKAPSDQRATEEFLLQTLRRYRRVFESSVNVNESKSAAAWALLVQTWMTKGPMTEFCDDAVSPLINDSYRKGSNTIEVGLLSYHRPELARPIIAHEIGHAAAAYMYDWAVTQSSPGQEYGGVPVSPRAWSARACANSWHGNPLPAPKDLETDSEGRYTEEDFADRIEALVSKMNSDKSAVNSNCALAAAFTKRRRIFNIDKMLLNSPTDTHSSQLFRVIHFEQVARGKLGPACSQVAAKLEIPACFFKDAN